MYLILAWRNIWRNPRRTFITMASVFFAVLLAIIMRSATKGVYDNMTDTMVSFSSGYIQIHGKGYWNERTLDNAMTDSEAIPRSINSIYVESMVPRLETFALVSNGDKSAAAAVIGIDPEKEDKVTGISKKVIKGRFTEKTDNGLLVGKVLAALLHVKVGDSLVILGQGYHGTMAAALLPVAGIVSMGSPKLDEGMIYLPLQSAQSIFSCEGMLTSVSVMIKEPGKLNECKSSILAVTDTSRFEVMTWKEMLPELDQLIEADSAGHYIIIYVLYLVISFGLFGTMLMMTRERLHEFGILTAIGMKKHLLGWVVVMEIAMISLCGVIAASLTGYPLVTWFKYHPIHVGGRIGEVYEGFGLESIIPCSNDLAVIGFQALIVMCITLLLSVYPFISILRIRPIEAINS